METKRRDNAHVRGDVSRYTLQLCEVEIPGSSTRLSFIQGKEIIPILPKMVQRLPHPTPQDKTWIAFVDVSDNRYGDVSVA